MYTALAFVSIWNSKLTKWKKKNSLCFPHIFQIIFLIFYPILFRDSIHSWNTWLKLFTACHWLPVCQDSMWCRSSMYIVHIALYYWLRCYCCCVVCQSHCRLRPYCPRSLPHPHCFIRFCIRSKKWWKLKIEGKKRKTLLQRFNGNDKKNNLSGHKTHFEYTNKQIENQTETFFKVFLSQEVRSG